MPPNMMMSKPNLAESCRDKFYPLHKEFLAWSIWSHHIEVLFFSYLARKKQASDNCQIFICLCTPVLDEINAR